MSSECQVGEKRLRAAALTKEDVLRMFKEHNWTRVLTQGIPATAKTAFWKRFPNALDTEDLSDEDASAIAIWLNESPAEDAFLDKLEVLNTSQGRFHLAFHYATTVKSQPPSTLATVLSRLNPLNDEVQWHFGSEDLLEANDSLPIVCGESGSGKTHAALTQKGASFTVLIHVHPDVEQCVEEMEEAEQQSKEQEEQLQAARPHSNSTTNQQSPDQRTKFTGMISSWVMAALKRCGAPPQGALGVIVFDELCDHPMFLRLLCRYHVDCKKRLEDIYDGVTWKFLAVGTGLDAASTNPGTMPDTYKLKRLANDHLWDHVLRKAARQKDVEKLKRVVSRCPSLEALTHNARATRFLAAKISDLATSMFAPSDDDFVAVFSQFTAHILTSVARQYVGQNALSGIDKERLRTYTRYAVQLVHQADAIEAPDYATTLCGRLGLIVDQAERINCGSSSDGFHVIRTDQAHGTKLVLRQGQHRYEMSPAISAMLSCWFGYLPSLHSTSGRPLEETVARKLMLLFDAVHSADDARKAMGIPPASTSTPLPKGPVLHITAQARLARGNLNSAGTLDPISRGAKKLLDRLREEVPKRKAVVISNGAGAPHADTIVIAQGLLWLCQEKEYPEGSKQTEAWSALFDEEVKQMMCTDCDYGELPSVTSELQDISGAPKIDILCFSTDSNAATAKSGAGRPTFYVYTPKSHQSVIQPGTWPIFFDTPAEWEIA